MNVGSLFSGIGGMDEGLRRAGFEHVFFAESDPYRRSVLACHWPGVPIYHDVHQVNATSLRRGRGTMGAIRARADAERDGSTPPLESLDVDLLCGGFPCQDLSVAGQRRGLAGDRSGLFFEFARIADALRPRWLLVENVPGLLSSNGGRDFGVVLGTLADLGYGLGWRVLDSRFFGVPQRRRRVFIVGTLAVDDPRAAAGRAGEVLAVGSRCDRHPATRGEAREDVAGTLGGGAGERGWAQDTERMTFVASLSGRQGRNGDGSEETFIAERQIAPALTRNYGKQPDNSDTNLEPMLIAETVRSHPRPGSTSNGNLVAAPLSHGSNPNSNPAGRRREDDENLVTGKGNKEGTASIGVQQGASVRRLTPTECERLQGLPDGWTQLGNTADSKRYAALGDAVTANVAEWIGRRLIAAGSPGGPA